MDVSNGLMEQKAGVYQLSATCFSRHPLIHKEGHLVHFSIAIASISFLAIHCIV